MYTVFLDSERSQINLVMRCYFPDECQFCCFTCKVKTTVKPVLNGHLKIDKTKVLMETDSLMDWRSKVLQNAPLGAFCNTFELH